jgi:starvation-inducible DNA-binding protein
VIRDADILPLGEYERQRGELRGRAMSARAARRVQLGRHASLAFENAETIRYQIHEILRAERISDPHAVGEEIQAYSQLLPGPSELAATLFIEYADRAERDRALVNLVGIEDHLYLELRGERRRARFDSTQTDGRRISAVQFVRFPLEPADIDAFRHGAPMRIVLDHPRYRAEAPVPRSLAAELAADLDQAAGVAALASDATTESSRGDESMSMYRSPSKLPEDARVRLVDALNARLADGLDLHGQIKVAHWNIKGPLFPSLHPLFETFAVALAGFNDEVAERAVTLGGIARGTARHVASRSIIPEYPPDTTRDLEHVALLADRIEAYLGGARESRATAASLGDDESVDLFTRIIQAFEKNAWFLRASLG